MSEGQVRTLSHIYLPGHGVRKQFTAHGAGSSKTPPMRDRASHAAKLKGELNAAILAAEIQNAGRDATIAQGERGFYLDFELPITEIAVVDRLENRQVRPPIELVSVRNVPESDDKIIATVFVPEEKKDHYIGKIEKYQFEDTPKTGRPQNETLVAAINAIQLGGLLSLYVDDFKLFPDVDQETLWEIWLRKEKSEGFQKIANALNLQVQEHPIRFVEREVVLVRATPRALNRLILHTDAVAELRLNRDTPAMFMAMPSTEQAEWLGNVLDRLELPSDAAPAVCVLDSGVNRRHPLIEPVLSEGDHQAILPDWTPHDLTRGHGTAMCGLALYGDLTSHLTGTSLIALTHRLESVKILPDVGANKRGLYGAVTGDAIARAEIQAPLRRRVFCLAVTERTDELLRGRPSSWSAKIDELTYGDGEGKGQRLVVISAGNTDPYPVRDYLTQNDLSGIQSPAQAWNALSVGAVTDRCNITDRDFAGWKPWAKSGDLSPRSRTSVNFQKGWPIKPDVVFEGGNYGVDPSEEFDHLDDLALLTTHHQLQGNLLATLRDTSAATALASNMAAKILADNPQAWPETIRGLMVHSARWTTAMQGHLHRPTESFKKTLLRRYGYGVPDLQRARRSAENDVAMIVENQLRPFVKTKNGIKTSDMALHEFPWPKRTLEALGEREVSLRVTLSYFIEPNPGERGWQKRHRYASHLLRFAVKRSDETLAGFQSRINKAASEEDEDSWMDSTADADDDGWFLGARLSRLGSLHSNIWTGTAADLASRHAIAVYPAGGWWREKPAFGRHERQIRYSLIVSLEAPVGIDLYTPIQTLISPDVEISS